MDIPRLLLRSQIFQPRLPCISLPNSSRKDADMSTIQTWTLWQRMPPRYQLTSRFYEEDAEELPVSFTPERLPSNRSSASNSRPTSGMNKQPTKTQPSGPRPQSGSLSPRKTNKMTSSQDENGNFMLSTSGQIPHNVQTEPITDVPNNSQSKFSFPRRKSDYINNFQKQKRVNSARRRLAECPPSPSVGASPSPGLSPSPRAHTAPVYPVTNPDNHPINTATNDDVKIDVNVDSSITTNNTRNVVMTPKKSTKSETTKVGMFQFDDAKSASSSASGMAKSTEKQPSPKKYLIQDTSRSTMYIDNGKVMCFGKSRHDLTQLLKTQSLRRDRNKGFFSELRRDYLTHPKYSMGRSKEGRENDPRRVAHERNDYNRKVENILNYYSDGDQTQTASPATSRPSSRYRARSPTGGRMKGLALTVNAPSRPPSRAESPVPEKGDTFGGFIKMNRQSKLYDRKFYLRTPALGHDGYSETQLENCRCSMCRIELQLSIMTGVNRKAMIHDTHVANTRELNNKHDSHTERTRVVDGTYNGNEFTTNGKYSYKDDTTCDKSSQLKVTFKQPDVEESVQEQRTLTISCTLPEMTHLTQSENASESGFESSRTVVSMAPTDVTA